MTSPRLNRRSFLRNSALFAGSVAVGAPLLSACSDSGTDDSGSGSGGSGSLGSSVTFQLGWLANAENMGIFMAKDKGYFAAQGLDTTIVPGGPSISVGPLIASNKALVGLDSADTIARARKEGARLKIVAATLQKNPSAVMSLAGNPIRTPQDLVGKKLGVQQSGNAIYDAFLTANDIDPKSVTYVPVQFDPAPLVNGEVDAFASFQTVQPIQLQQQGVPTESFLLADFGYAIWADTFVVSEDTLADEDRRDQLVRLVRASVQGWQDAVADPAEGARLAVEKYGRSLNLDATDQTLAAKAFVPLISTAETKASGLLTMSEAGIEANIATMRSVGIDAAADELFDTSVLADAFAGKTTL
jgi:ABC-type nitrate/sulfonate/bicarbonate transport system substrate-binding protein